MNAVFVFYVLLLRSYSEAEKVRAVTKEEVEIVSELCGRLRCKESVFLGCGHVSAVKQMSEANIISSAVPSDRIREFGSGFSVGTLIVEKKEKNGSDGSFYESDFILANFSFACPFFFMQSGFTCSVSKPLFYRLVFDDSAMNKSSEKGKTFSIRPSWTGFRVQEIFHGKQVREFSSFESEAETRVDFRGIFLKVAKDTGKGCEKLEDLHVFQKARCFHDYISNLMSVRLNFTEQETECPEKTHRYVFPNGSYSGLFKMLLDGEADFSTGSFVVSANRLTTFDFVWPTFALKTMMYVKPGESKGHWNSYVKPFSSEVWWIWMTTVVTSGLVFFLVDRLSRKYSEWGKIRNVHLSHCFLSAFGIFCNQASTGNGHADSVSARIYRFAVLLVALMLYYIYSGSVLSSLTIHKPGLPFTDLDGFFSDGSYKMTAVNDSFMLYYFKYEYVPRKEVTAENFLARQNEIPKSDRQGIDGVCEGSLSYLGIKENVLSLKEYKCEVVEIPNPVFVQYLAIGVLENSSLREYFSRELSYYRSNGILKRMEFGFRSTRFGSKPSVKKKEVPPVALSEIVSALAFLAGGVWASCCAFLAERIAKSIGTSIFFFPRRFRPTRRFSQKTRSRVFLNNPLFGERHVDRRILID